MWSARAAATAAEPARVSVCVTQSELGFVGQLCARGGGPEMRRRRTPRSAKPLGNPVRENRLVSDRQFGQTPAVGADDARHALFLRGRTVEDDPLARLPLWLAALGQKALLGSVPGDDPKARVFGSLRGEDEFLAGRRPGYEPR